MKNYIDEAIQQQQLPTDFSNTVEKWFKPIATEVAERAKHQPGSFILGVQGTQGSGKSTLASFICLLLEKEFQLSAVSLSIDDFYLTLEERKQLSENVHPLLLTRGVPGTHDVHLALETIENLRNNNSETSCLVPRFNKALDDRFNKDSWDEVRGRVDVIVLEGWCVGVPPQPESELAKAVNALEQEEDTNGQWRKYVNDSLKNNYTNLFNTLDALVVLSAPSFDCVYQWRLLQEQKLKDSWEKLNPSIPAKIQSPEQIKRFISHYQRLTEHGLKELPKKCDWQLVLSADHKITNLNQNIKEFA